MNYLRGAWHRLVLPNHHSGKVRQVRGAWHRHVETTHHNERVNKVRGAWQSARGLAPASPIAIETAELMEHFQWLTPEQSLEMCGKIDVTSQVAEEMADVLSYVLSLANALDIDITQAFPAKMAKNRAKYPAS